MGEFEEFINNHTRRAVRPGQVEDGRRTTLSAGVRYDLEIIPIDETDNPLFPAGNKQYPVDRNNFAPRIGLTHALDDEGKSVIRGGYGMFYNRTVLGAIDDTIEYGKFITRSPWSTSRTTAPTRARPRAGSRPIRFLVVTAPSSTRRCSTSSIRRGALSQHRRRGFRFPGSAAAVRASVHGRLRARVERDARRSSRLHPHANKDMFLARNLNPMVRANTTRTGPITRVDAFGVLGEPYSQQVWVMENTGEADYDALNLSLEKRYSNNWSGRVSYSLSKSQRNGREPGRHEHLPVPDRPQPGRAVRAATSTAGTSCRSTAARKFRRPRGSRCRPRCGT